MKEEEKMKTHNLVYTAVFVVLMAVCSWISIPMTVPFTLQTFAVFLSVYLLGGKRGTIVILVYILLGAIGIPVFSGFQGGVGVLLSNTGGYIIGFIGISLVMWASERVGGNRIWIRICSMIVGLLICYLIGTVWFQLLYFRSTGTVEILTVLSWCVFPFILPDIVKMALAVLVGERIKKIMKKKNII